MYENRRIVTTEEEKKSFEVILQELHSDVDKCKEIFPNLKFDFEHYIDDDKPTADLYSVSVYTTVKFSEEFECKHTLSTVVENNMVVLHYNLMFALMSVVDVVDAYRNTLKYNK